MSGVYVDQSQPAGVVLGPVQSDTLPTLKQQPAIHRRLNRLGAAIHPKGARRSGQSIPRKAYSFPALLDLRQARAPTLETLAGANIQGSLNPGKSRASLFQFTGQLPAPRLFFNWQKPLRRQTATTSVRAGQHPRLNGSAWLTAGYHISAIRSTSPLPVDGPVQKNAWYSSARTAAPQVAYQFQVYLPPPPTPVQQRRLPPMGQTPIATSHLSTGGRLDKLHVSPGSLAKRPVFFRTASATVCGQYARQSPFDQSAPAA